MANLRTQGSSLPAWPVAMLVVGVILSATGMMFRMFAPKTDNLTAQAEGIVSRVEVKTRSGSRDRGSRSILTYVRFEDSDHIPYEARSVVNGSPQRHYEGDAVTVLYNPRDPGAGCLIEGDEDRLLVFTLVGRVCCYGGPAALVVGAAGTLWALVARRTKA